MPDLVYRNTKGSKLNKDEGDSNFRALNIYSRIVNAEWRYVPSIFKLYMSGSGTITIDAKNPTGVVTTVIYTTSLTNANGELLFPFVGNDTSQIKITLTGTLTGEVI